MFFQKVILDQVCLELSEPFQMGILIIIFAVAKALEEQNSSEDFSPCLSNSPIKMTFSSSLCVSFLKYLG